MPCPNIYLVLRTLQAPDGYSQVVMLGAYWRLENAEKTKALNEEYWAGPKREKGLLDIAVTHKIQELYIQDSKEREDSNVSSPQNP